MIEITREEKNWATGLHLSAFLNLIVPFGSILGPLVFWLIKKDSSTYIDQEGKEAVNFNISYNLYIICLIFIGFIQMISRIASFEELSNAANSSQLLPLISSLLIWLIPLLMLSILWFILIILAAVKANSGLHFHYPFTIRFIH